MSSKIVALILGLIFLLGVRTFLRERFQKTITAATAQGPASCLSLAGNTTREENGFTYIVGSVKNGCDRKVDSATIVFLVDSPMGSKFERRDVSVQAYARNIAPGETREFKTMTHIGSGASYRFDKIVAF